MPKLFRKRIVSECEIVTLKKHTTTLPQGIMQNVDLCMLRATRVLSVAPFSKQKGIRSTKTYKYSIVASAVAAYVVVRLEEACSVVEILAIERLQHLICLKKGVQGVQGVSPVR